MKLLLIFLGIALMFLVPSTAYASFGNPEVTNFANQTLETLLILASLASVFFLIRGGYGYITSSGKPENLEHAKTTIRNALIGLVIIISATVIQSLLVNAFTTPATGGNLGKIVLTPIQPATPSNGLTQVLLDAIAGFMQNIIQSATKPLVDGIIGFLTTTPEIAKNSVVFNFWLTILGITDSLFVLIIAFLGFRVMSASTFGFEEVELKQLLPRIGLAFLGANTSIFLADWIVLSSNTMVKALLNATGGLTNAWVLNAFDPATLTAGNSPIITLIFMLLFVIIAVVLLLFYISRLILISLGAVLSPLIFLLWLIPKFSDFAEVSVKSYIVMVYTVFVHVVIIQLASAFLSIPEQSGANNSLISILIAIGLFFTLLKVPSTMMQLVFYTSKTGAFKKIGGQIINVISTTNNSSDTRSAEVSKTQVKTPRKAVSL